MEEEVSRFRSELLLRDARDICRRFLIFGSCTQLDDERYYGLKAAVAEEFNIHPNEIIVVGSTKLGFSIVPAKRYRAFGETSDIDVAIVSPQLFDRVWHEVFRYLDSARSWQDRREFANYFVRGWVRPDKLPPGENFQFTQDWFEFFRHLSNSREFGDIKIAGALYRDWIFLEKYQESCILKCREAEEAIG
jgi:predicted nucleotidyltransferase